MDGIGDILNDTEKLKQSLSNNVIESDPFEIDKIADLLEEKLKAPSSRGFFCMAAKYLTRGELERHAINALEKGKEPAKLFNHVVSRRLLKIGVEVHVKKHSK